MPSSQLDSSLFNSSLGVDANYASSSCLDYLSSFAGDRLFPDSFTIEIPKLPALESFGWTTYSHIISGEYRISFPDIYVLHTLNIGLLCSLLIGFIISRIIYHGLLRKKQEDLSPLQILLGVVLVAASASLPYGLIDLMNAENTAVRFVICLPFVLFFFRTLEAIFGFTPHGATSSSKIYSIYFTMPVEMIFDGDNKPVIASRDDILHSIKKTAYSILILISLISILSPHDYTPFGKTVAGEYYEYIIISEYLHPGHLGNCFLIALLFQQALGLGDAIFGNIVQILFGYKVVQGMRNPMLEATSPSDFWGRRWNVLVHSVMKRGVYKPIRKYSSSLLASLGVFVASGLFHEWLVYTVLLYNRTTIETATNKKINDILLGSNTAFFLWNFVVIVGERILAGSKFFRNLGSLMPRGLVTFMIIMTSLPCAHWFGNPYVKGNFFEDYERCVPVVAKI